MTAGNNTYKSLNEKYISIMSLIENLNYETAKKELSMLGDLIYKNYGLILCKTFILFHEGKYEEAYPLFEDLDKSIVYFNYAINLIKLKKYDELNEIYNEYFCSDKYKKLDFRGHFKILKWAIEDVLFIPKEPFIPKDYYENQAYNYSEEALISHVKERHTLNGSEIFRSIEEKTKFTDEVDIESLYQDIKKLIKENPNKCSLLSHRVTDRFLIKMPGYAENDNLKYITVDTFFHNHNIYTFYPSREYDIEIIEPKKEEYVSPNKVKRLSQIEKFNQRYGNK